MEKQIIVRKAKMGDFDKFYKLFQKTLREGYFYGYSRNSIEFILSEDMPKAEVKKLIAEDKRILYLGLDGKKVAGYLLTFKTREGVSFGHWLGVDKNYQRKGVATTLLEKWQETAFAEGAHKLQLWTTKNNLTFYKNRGFTVGGKFPESWFGRDHYLIYKTLRKPNEKLFLSEFLKKRQRPST